jgi:prepilin-type N-terminal cleavage/methylation domain-containing protein
VRSRKQSSAGFSLIELMVAVAIMGIVTAQLFVVFANQKKVFTSNDRALDVQEAARLTLDLISFDTRMAGFMVPKYTAVSSVDGGANGADRFCASAPGSAGSGGTVPTMVARFNGATLVNNITANSVTVNTTDLDLDGDGIADFVVQSGVIVASETRTYCARISAINVNGATATIDFANPEDATVALGGTTPTSDMRAVPANVYEIDTNALQLRRNNLLLASQIEDFEVEYWLDTAGTPNGVEDGNQEFPVNDLNNPDPPAGAGSIPSANDEVRRVRISVTARTVQEDQADSATGKLTYGRPALANHAAGAAVDQFRRRTFSASIAPRNIL